MVSQTARLVLVAALGLNAGLGLGYRIYRLTRGGPVPDVIGQAILGIALALVAAGVALGQAWARWVALGYGLTFGLVVMPVWALAVLIPLPPSRVDYAFTVLYWAALPIIVVASLLL